MSIVQAGKTFTADDLKKTAGTLAALIHGSVQDGADLATQLGTWTAADLIELGLTQPEIDAQKGFFIGDLAAIVQALKDSVWLKQLLGTGV